MFRDCTESTKPGRAEMSDSPRSAFSPLALTQTLPFLPLAQGDVDYHVARRGQPDLMKDLTGSPAVDVILVDRDHLAVPKGQGATAGRRHARIRLAMLPATYLAGVLDGEDQESWPLYYLGSKDGRDYLALDLGLLGQGAGDGLAADPGLGQSARERFDWLGLREFAPHGAPRQVGLATSAVSLSMWQNRQRFCPTCGSPVEPCMGGWAQHCLGADSGHTLFPRIEPAVIMSVVDSQDRLLLQHNSAWGPDFHSVAAGFVEAGENLEHAVRRETMEEVGIRVGEVHYMGSQPWPFPSSLMVAFKARALQTDIRVDGQETKEAAWFTRDDLSARMAAGTIRLPKRATIARFMIEEWYGTDLEE